MIIMWVVLGLANAFIAGMNVGRYLISHQLVDLFLCVMNGLLIWLCAERLLSQMRQKTRIKR